MLAVPRPRDATSDFVKGLFASLSLVLLLLSFPSYFIRGKSERGTVLSQSNNSYAYPNPRLFTSWIGVVSAARRSSSLTSADTAAEITVFYTVSLRIMNVPIFNRLARHGPTFELSARVQCRRSVPWASHDWQNSHQSQEENCTLFWSLG